MGNFLTSARCHQTKFSYYSRACLCRRASCIRRCKWAWCSECRVRRSESSIRCHPRFGSCKVSACQARSHHPASGVSVRSWLRTLQTTSGELSKDFLSLRPTVGLTVPWRCIGYLAAGSIVNSSPTVSERSRNITSMPGDTCQRLTIQQISEVVVGRLKIASCGGTGRHGCPT